VTTISPVSMPTRICRRTPCEASICTLSCSRAAIIDSAARTARAASSSFDRYRPKTAIAASPMNFSTTPPSASTAPRTAAK
jgi:hypothetical protein